MKVQYQTMLLKYDRMGEKTGWTYIEIPADVAARIKPGVKKSYRVKGRLDNYPIKEVALLPMGEGSFIMPINSEMRRHLGKKHGATIMVQLEEDKTPFRFNADLMACLAEEPAALAHFKQMPGSHQKYFSKWVDSAKTDATVAKRIVMTVNAMLKKQDFGEMLRSQRS